MRRRGDGRSSSQQRYRCSDSDSENECHRPSEMGDPATDDGRDARGDKDQTHGQETDWPRVLIERAGRRHKSGLVDEER